MSMTIRAVLESIAKSPARIAEGLERLGTVAALAALLAVAAPLEAQRPFVADPPQDSVETEKRGFKFITLLETGGVLYATGNIICWADSEMPFFEWLQNDAPCGPDAPDPYKLALIGVAAGLVYELVMMNREMPIESALIPRPLPAQRGFAFGWRFPAK